MKRHFGGVVPARCESGGTIGTVRVVGVIGVIAGFGFAWRLHDMALPYLHRLRVASVIYSRFRSTILILSQTSEVHLSLLGLVKKSATILNLQNASRFHSKAGQQKYRRFVPERNIASISKGIVDYTMLLYACRCRSSNIEPPQNASR